MQLVQRGCGHKVVCSWRAAEVANRAAVADDWAQAGKWGNCPGESGTSCSVPVQATGLYCSMCRRRPEVVKIQRLLASFPQERQLTSRRLVSFSCRTRRCPLFPPLCKSLSQNPASLPPAVFVFCLSRHPNASYSATITLEGGAMSSLLIILARLAFEQPHFCRSGH